MRIALDTNEFVHALMRPASLATFVMAWAAKRFSVVCSQDLLDEYLYVLTYPKIAGELESESVRAFRDYLIEDIELVTVPDIGGVCRDPEDDKVVAVAASGGIDYLVTDDNDLRATEVTELLRQSGVEVISSDILLRIIG